MSASGGFDLASIPERIQSEVQHQGRRIYLLGRPLARLDVEGHPGRSRHYEPLSLPAHRG
jgi:hypothetical protein